MPEPLFGGSVCEMIPPRLVAGEWLAELRFDLRHIDALVSTRYGQVLVDLGGEITLEFELPERQASIISGLLVSQVCETQALAISWQEVVFLRVEAAVDELRLTHTLSGDQDLDDKYTVLQDFDVGGPDPDYFSQLVISSVVQRADDVSVALYIDLCLPDARAVRLSPPQTFSTWKNIGPVDEEVEVRGVIENTVLAENQLFVVTFPRLATVAEEHALINTYVALMATDISLLLLEARQGVSTVIDLSEARHRAL